ncbi:MAG: DNA replication and repair protein RecF [Acidobacteria bacterium]|nr:DNA replication and repair protein RecF [Acidobacteriota bacterium]
MILTKVEARSFRNIIHDQFEPSHRLNFLYGSNAQGKTNWLEAIHLLATTSSFRTARLSEVLTHDCHESILRASVSQYGLQKDLAVQLTSRSKSLFVNGKREPSSRYIGHLTVFVCSLEQMNIVRGEPEHRRHFLDQGALSIDPKYAKVLETYHRILKQKNQLLRQAAEQANPNRLIDQIQIWNEQLIEYGTMIHRVRFQYVEKLQEVLSGNLFGKEEIRVCYASSLEAHGDMTDYAGLLAERLQLRLNAELAMGYSLVGPHRDDLGIRFDDRDLRPFASAGQQRSTLLILDLARISVYNKVFDEYPVFLVDDIDAELDRRRIEVLLDYLQDKTQTFVTTSKRDIATSYSGLAAVFRIEEGQVATERRLMHGNGAEALVSERE